MSRLIDAAPMLEFLDLQHYDKDMLVSQYSADWIYSWLESQPTIEQPKWISSHKALPTYGERVLAYVCGRIEPLVLFYRDLLIEDYWEDDVGRVILLKAVTHWMPLPQLPKEGE